MKQKPPRMEQIVYRADRKVAKAIMKLFLKILTKDQRSDGMNFSYSYRRKTAHYTVEGDEKTVKKCISSFDRYVKKYEANLEKIEKAKQMAQPLKVAKYYTMKPLKERTRKG
jgi:hypothetical protein